MLATVPPNCVNVMGFVAEKPPPVFVEISKPVGGTIDMSFVKLLPEITKVCSTEGVLIAVVENSLRVPTLIVGLEDTVPLTLTSSITYLSSVESVFITIFIRT